MLNFFSIILIIVILIFLLIFKRKYIFNSFNKNNLHAINDLNNKNKQIISTAKYSCYFYKNNSKKYSEFSKRNFKKKMFNFYKGTPEDKLESLKIAEKLADKFTLPILRKGLKDINPEIVERAAFLVKNFK